MMQYSNMKKKLIIDNIGPIKHVELDLKRVNVIIGPQSAGKSCILKIACFCAWAEKRIQLEQGKNGFDDKNYMEENLINFHKLGGFFEKGNGAKLRYETEHLWFQYEYDKLADAFTWGWVKEGHWTYKRSRVSYIPAERNVIATIPNWLEVSMKYNSIRNFVSDWMLTRTFYTKENKLDVLGLGVKYYYDEQSGQDYIELENGNILQLTNGSSGIQSAVPMLVYLGFLFENQYKSGQYGKISVETENEEILTHIYEKKRFGYGLKKFMASNAPFIGKIGVGKKMFKSAQDYKECKELFEAYTKTWSSDIYLEEPEQNLFPETQVKLMYELLGNSKQRQDSLFISTHSPYVLYALNNAMLAYYVQDTVIEEMRPEIGCLDYAYDPEQVSVWQIEDGHFVGMDAKNVTIQDAKHLIRKNFFDSIMSGIMDDFNNMVNFYES